MQIDFHHGVTYVVARLAGFDHAGANIIAYSAQYVDDATNEGRIAFDCQSMYFRIASAHKMLDYANFDVLANHHAWIPFHFLPGNDGLPAGQGEDIPFSRRIICRPNSYIAQDMVKECIRRRSDPNALQRLGITMHVYADTWAHQGFCGITHAQNNSHDLRDADHQPDTEITAQLKDFFGAAFDSIQSKFVGNTMPLGHGTVLSYPDRPYLRWSYTNGLGEKIHRDNPTDFLNAAQHMCKAMQCFLAGDPNLDAPGLADQDRKQIDTLIRSIVHEDGDQRHQVWLTAVRNGDFSFGPCALSYVAKGEHSWKYDALGTTASVDDEKTIYRYQTAFLKSNWKRFHDALQAHRLYVEHELLPEYGICAA